MIDPLYQLLSLLEKLFSGGLEIFALESEIDQKQKVNFRRSEQRMIFQV